jgi:transcription termination/antitermination protein NusG
LTAILAVAKIGAKYSAFGCSLREVLRGNCPKPGKRAVACIRAASRELVTPVIRPDTSNTESLMRENWFAVRTKSNREAVVSEALAGKGYETLYPRYSAPARKGQRQPEASTVKPLFPGYVFCKFDVLVRMPILTVPGVMNVVSTGRQPIPLDDSEIESLKVLLSSNLPIGPHAYLKIGDPVLISQGPLAGASGYIVQTDQRRLVVSITLLQRAVSVEVDGEWLEKMPAMCGAAAGAASPYDVWHR